VITWHGHLDLHGLTREQAKAEVAQFLVSVRQRDIRCVRIIHGRGRKNAEKAPVLKRAIDGWLRNHKQVIAYCSARDNDGGTGAVYIEAIEGLRTQLETKGNTNIQMPEYFNFGFDVIDDIANKRDKTAYIEVDASGTIITEHSFSDLRDRSNQMANLLKEQGVKKGDFAVVLLPRIGAWYETMIGCIKSGVVAMPGTNLLTARDIEFRINHAQATAVIVSEEHVEKIAEIKSRCPSLKHFLVVGCKREGWISVDEELPKATKSFTQSDADASRSDDIMLAYFTSGTTANPKLVARNHGYALAHYITGAYWLNLDTDDIHWTLSDTGWAKAAWGMLFGPWLMESAMVLYNGSGFEAELHLKLIEQLKVTSFCAPPTIYRLFAQMPLSEYNLSSIRHATGAGEPLNPEVIRIWKDATDTDIHDGYGQTETVCIVANQSGFAVRPGSMGKATPGFDVKVVDDNGKEVEVDEIGHIAIRMTDINLSGALMMLLAQLAIELARLKLKAH